MFAYHLYKEKQIVNDKVLLLNGQVEELKKTNSEQESAIEEMEDTIREMSVSIRGVENSNYNQEYTYYLTRGKILFYLCKFEESKTAFNTGLELNKENGNLFNDWIKKVEEELKP